MERQAVKIYSYLSSVLSIKRLLLSQWLRHASNANLIVNFQYLSLMSSSKSMSVRPIVRRFVSLKSKVHSDCHGVLDLKGKVGEERKFLKEKIIIWYDWHRQFFIAKLSSSSVIVQSNLNWDLALNLVLTTPTPTHPPGKVEMQPLLDYLGHWNWVWKLYSTKLGQLANSYPQAILQEKPWLAISIWSYLSHLKSDFDCVKSLLIQFIRCK